MICGQPLWWFSVSVEDSASYKYKTWHITPNIYLSHDRRKYLRDVPLNHLFGQKEGFCEITPAKKVFAPNSVLNIGFTLKGKSVEDLSVLGPKLTRVWNLYKTCKGIHPLTVFGLAMIFSGKIIKVIEHAKRIHILKVFSLALIFSGKMLKVIEHAKEIISWKFSIASIFLSKV